MRSTLLVQVRAVPGSSTRTSGHRARAPPIAPARWGRRVTIGSTAERNRAVLGSTIRRCFFRTVELVRSDAISRTGQLECPGQPSVPGDGQLRAQRVVLG